MIWIVRAVCIPQVGTIFQQILGAFFALVSSANFLHVHSTKHIWCVTLVTTAMYTGFGDPNRHPPRTTAITLSQLESIQCDPNDAEGYFAACERFQLSGVVLPFWCNYPYADPSQFLTPEALHYWHCKFWDHDMQWCKHALGAQELDFRFSVLPPITGLRRFREGVTKLKQVGGRTQRDAQ